MKTFKRTTKRREARGILFATLLFFFLFPYVFSNFSKIEKQEVEIEEAQGKVWVAKEKIWGKEKVLLEDYLVGMMVATIPVEYEVETLKAQAVLLRSFCMSFMEKQDGIKIISDEQLKEHYFTEEQARVIWEENYDINITKMKEAVKSTEGMVLVWQGQILNPPFFRVSNGMTRDITEYMVHIDEWAYMKQAKCGEDIKSPEYIHYIQISQKDFKKKMAKLLGEYTWKMEKITLTRDSAGYVKELQVGENTLSGEDFRYEMELPSACFTLERVEDNIEIQVKGMGHGFGFSQYQANQQAKLGKDFITLLNLFFQNFQLEKI